MEYANGLFASFSVSFTISISLARSFFLLVLSDFPVSAKKKYPNETRTNIFKHNTIYDTNECDGEFEHFRA